MAGCTGKSIVDPATTPTPDSNCAETDNQPCPPFETARNRAVCSHTVEPNVATVYIEPDPECSTLDNGRTDDEITLAFRNQSSEELSFNPYSWRIWHNTEGEWKELEQEVSGNGRVIVAARDTHSWTFMEAVESIQEEPKLEPGLYGAEMGVPDPKNGNGRVACIALIQLEAQ